MYMTSDTFVNEYRSLIVLTGLASVFLSSTLVSGVCRKRRKAKKSKSKKKDGLLRHDDTT